MLLLTTAFAAIIVLFVFTVMCTSVRAEADIEITKTASLNGTCPGSDPLIVHIGDTVTYCYKITDDIHGPVALGKTTLAPDESTEGTTTHAVTESYLPSVTNIATATGIDPKGGTVTDEDDCTINTEISPRIEIVKTASSSFT